jgi:hypothetical protein
VKEAGFTVDSIGEPKGDTNDVVELEANVKDESCEGFDDESTDDSMDNLLD